MEQLDLREKRIRKRSHGKRQCILGGILLLLCILGTSGLFLLREYQRENYIKQAREAYSLGLYEKAVYWYQQSLSYHPDNLVEVVLELSDSCNSLGRYEEAAEVLQKYYKETKDVRLKERFHLVVDLITEEQYKQSMNRGELYLESENYDKAIQEFKEAYRICPKKQDVVEAIIITYLRAEKVVEAKEFFQEVVSNFDEERLAYFENLIHDSEIQIEYDRMLEEAEEAFYVDNYKECFQLYRKAIQLIPGNIIAYERMVDAYISRREFEAAVKAIQLYEKIYEIEELGALEKSIYFRKEEEEKINSIMKKLYKGIGSGNIPYILELVGSANYKRWITQGNTYYYDAVEGYRSLKMPVDRGIVIYSNGYIYCGSFSNGKRSGDGRLFGIKEEDNEYFLFTGEWQGDSPEGEGVLNTTMKVPQEKDVKKYNVLVQGQFVQGRENGEMRRDFYDNNQYYGTLEYNCINGIPQPILQEPLNPKWNVASIYSIGKLITTEGTQDFQYQYTQDCWRVPGF